MKRARIKYVEDYNGREGYLLEISIDDEDWGMDSFYPLFRREGAAVEEEKNFVSYAVINKIKELISLGYKIL